MTISQQDQDYPVLYLLLVKYLLMGNRHHHRADGKYARKSNSDYGVGLKSLSGTSRPYRRQVKVRIVR